MAHYTLLNHRRPCFRKEQSSSRSAPIPDIYYFQNTLEVTSVQLILSFSLTSLTIFAQRALESASAAYASLNLSLLYRITPTRRAVCQRQLSFSFTARTGHCSSVEQVTNHRRMTQVCRVTRTQTHHGASR